MAFTPGDEIFDWTTVDGSQITGTMMNLRIQQPLEAAVAGLSSLQTYLQYNQAAYSAPANTDVPLAYDTVIRNTLGATFVDNGTGQHEQIVLPRAGLYLCSCAVQANATTSTASSLANYFMIGFRKNGNAAANVGPRAKDFIIQANNRSYAQAVGILQFAANDTVGVWYYGTIAAQVFSGNSETSLVVSYLGS